MSDSYQEDFSRRLQAVVQVHYEGTFAHGQGISLCLHLTSHVLIHHVGLLHNLGAGNIQVTLIIPLNKCTSENTTQTQMNIEAGKKKPIEQCRLYTSM